MNKSYLAVSPNYWGKGKTINAAKAALKKSGGTVKGCSIYEAHDNTTVDDLGHIYSPVPLKHISGPDLRDR